jgi:23S rRNA (cytosine1962-C5)-methyltransferase
VVDLQNLLRQAIQKREPLRQYTNAVRLINGAGDRFDGLILEQYDHHFVAQIFDTRWLSEKKSLTDFVKNQLGGRYFIVKDRTQSASSNPDAFKTAVWIKADSSQTVVQEHGLKFGVDLNDALNTGLFLDMRLNRKIIGALSRGRKVLNCFSYTCSFGVSCRAGGATSVVNVDVSVKSLTRGKSNYELNGIVPAQNEFIRADAVDYLQKANQKKNRFDLIILDPPSFARSEKKTFRVQKDLQPLIASAIQALNPKGFLFVSTNFNGLSCQQLENSVRQSAAGRTVQEIQRLGQDADFAGTGWMPESYLAALLVKIS